MGGRLQRNDSLAPGNYPGCMAGILRILDYHHWHVKRLLPHKKQHGGKRRGRRNESSKVVLEKHDLSQAFIDADSEPLLVKHHDNGSVPASRRPGKNRQNFPSKENHRTWFLSFSLHSWLHKINLAHHLEPSEHCYDDMETDERSPVFISQKTNANIRINKSGTFQANEASRDVSDDQLGECDDILELFKVNKEFFMKFLQDPNACRNKLHGLKNSNIKVRLGKSNSFPVARSRSVKQSTLKHKQNEVWLFLNGDKSVASTLERKLEQHCTVSMKANNDGGIEREVKQTKVSSLDSSKAFSSNHGWNQVVINRFRHVKQKIKHALKENKREKNRPVLAEELPRDFCEDGSSMEAIEVLERLEITIGQQSNETGGLNEDDHSKPRVRHVKRTSSLNESLDRYTQLFDNTFGRDAKYSQCRSLTLSTSEEEKLSHARKAYRRNLSLPDLDSLSSFLNVAKHRVSRSRLSLDIEGGDSIANFEYSSGVSAVEEHELEMPSIDDITEYTNELERASRSSQEDETCDARYQYDQEAETETCFLDCLSSPAVFPLPKGLELDSKCPQQDWTENEDFLFVKQIIKLSIFPGADEALTLHSLDWPLSPSLLKRLDSCVEDEITTDSHRLLFDLVNETLGGLNEESYTYFPRPRFLAMPKGDRLFTEVWTRTSSYLSLRPELDSSLDDVVARDLAKKDADWLSPEWERDMVALELEDLIFDQLLDEVLLSLD